MKFASRAERMEWLKAAANQIQQMEQQRKVCIMSGEFGKAFGLLKGIKFARTEFAKQSKIYAKRKF
jgi:hypothetical protein